MHNGYHHHYSYDDTYHEYPDYIANDVQHQLPMISTIGRGPRGFGIIAKKVKGEDGSYRILFVNDVTGEVVETPDLDPGHIEITQTPNHTPQEGEVVNVMIRHVRGGATVSSYNITVPPGAHGSRLYLSGEKFDYREDLTYVTPIDDLIHYGKQAWKDKPIPRPGDIVCFTYNDKYYSSLAFGTIEAVENNQVVFTSRTRLDVPLPTIGKDGHWYVDGEDTGINAQGPKGEKGDKGDTGPQGKQGMTGATGKAGAKGDKGDPGLDAKIELGDVTTAPYGFGASITSKYDKKTNTTTFNFALPEGSPGKAIDIQGGIWTIDTLPDYDDVEVNTAFIVYDGDKQFDLYIRGSYPVTAGDGGPWTIVEDWQGRPGTSFRVIVEPYYLNTEIGGTIEITTAEAEEAFAYSDYLADDDIVVDKNGVMGIVSSAEDNSGTYIITTINMLGVSWEGVGGKPFDTVSDAFTINDGELDIPFVSQDTDGIVPRYSEEAKNYRRILAVTSNGAEWVYNPEINIVLWQGNTDGSDTLSLTAMGFNALDNYVYASIYAVIAGPQERYDNKKIKKVKALRADGTYIEGPVYTFSSVYGSLKPSDPDDIPQFESQHIYHFLYTNGHWIVTNVGSSNSSSGGSQDIPMVSKTENGILPHWNTNGQVYIGGNGWMNSPYYQTYAMYSSTTASTATKVCSQMAPHPPTNITNGTSIYVFFWYTNTTSNPQLSVTDNNGFTKTAPIVTSYTWTSGSPNAVNPTPQTYKDLQAFKLYHFIFDGNNWVVMNPDSAVDIDEFVKKDKILENIPVFAGKGSGLVPPSNGEDFATPNDAYLRSDGKWGKIDLLPDLPIEAQKELYILGCNTGELQWENFQELINREDNLVSEDHPGVVPQIPYVSSYRTAGYLFTYDGSEVRWMEFPAVTPDEVDQMLQGEYHPQTMAFVDNEAFQHFVDNIHVITAEEVTSWFSE